MAPKVDWSGAIGALEAAISAFRDQLELANRLLEQRDQARDTEGGRPDLHTRALAELHAERDGAEALRIQLESEVEKLRAELTKAETKARRRPWWHRLRRPRKAE